MYKRHYFMASGHAEYVEGETLVDMIKKDLVAERFAIDSYREMICYLGNDDPTTRKLLEGILAGMKTLCRMHGRWSRSQFVS